MRPTRSSFCFLVLALAGCATSSAEHTSAGALPVARAVLYQNGVGYLERRGRIEGDRLTLHVRPEQIRDVLKSLTIVDLGQGRAVSVGVPVEKSRAQAMSDLPEQVRGQGGVLALAQAFRGARCEVDAERSVRGRLVGVENLHGEGEGISTPDWRLSVLDDSGALQQLRVGSVKSLRVLDETLAGGLARALDLSLDAGSWKPVEVAVRLAGEGPHDLVVSYVVEMPTWKPAYRLVLGKEGKALLQGWAVVDNLSGEDWNQVQLQLTAGMPLAFLYDLYTPRIVQRPNLSPPDEVAQIPEDAYRGVGGMPAAPPSPRASPSAEGSDDEAERDRSDAPKRKALLKERAESESLGLRAGKASRPAAAPVTREQLERNFKTLVGGAQVGSLFRYDIADPVTIGDRRSALVNIVNANVAGEEVLLYRVGADAASPYRAVRLLNQTDFVLEGGPMAIYGTSGGAGTFVGEALAPRIEKGANLFVPFALEGRVRLTLDEEQREQGITLVKLIRGQITAETRRVTRFHYDVDNGSGEPVTLYVRRERRAGWQLVGKEKVIEEGGAYYVPIRLPKTGRVRVSVEEQTPVRQVVDIWNDTGRQVLALYLANPSADPKVAAQLREALALRERGASLEAQIQTLEEQRTVQAQRQSEVRENLKVLGKSSQNADLKRKLESTLVDLEQSLNELARKLVTLSIERGQVRDRLASLMKTITLDGPQAPAS